MYFIYFLLSDEGWDIFLAARYSCLVIQITVLSYALKGWNPFLLLDGIEGIACENCCLFTTVKGTHCKGASGHPSFVSILPLWSSIAVEQQLKASKILVYRKGFPILTMDYAQHCTEMKMVSCDKVFNSPEIDFV